MGDDLDELDVSEIDADEMMDEDDDENEGGDSSRPRKKARN